jgi:hypothetical protein
MVNTTTILLVLSTWMMGAAPASAQSSYDLYGSARADALGNGTTASGSATGVHANPAARARATSPRAVFYARESFGLSALRYGATHVTVPFDWGAVSTGASTFGFEDYREVHLSAGYARSVQFGTSRSVHVGATARYHHTSIAGYGSAGALGLNVGVGLRLLRSLRLGAHATNVNGASLVANEPIPRTLAVGLSYRALDQMHVLVDVFKDVRFPTTVRGGLEVRPVEPLALRAGVTSVPVRFAGGVGVRLGPLRADVAVNQHQELGWSPSASLQVRW